MLLSVSRLPGASTPDVVARVRAAVDEAARSFPSGVHAAVVYDQAVLVDESLRSIRDAILIGIALCIAVIALFLRDLRGGLVAALAVPLTLGATFIPVHLVGQSLNLMSMGGLAVAIGLVVDDAIVVVEAIRRRLEQGRSPGRRRAPGDPGPPAGPGGDHRDDGHRLSPAGLARGTGGPLLRGARGDPLGGRPAVTGGRADRRAAGGSRLDAAQLCALGRARALVRPWLHPGPQAHVATSVDRGRPRRAASGDRGRQRPGPGHGISARDGRGCVRPRLLPASRNLAGRHRRRRQEDRSRLADAPGRRHLLASHRRRARARGGDRGESRRHHGAPQVALGTRRSPPRR